MKGRELFLPRDSSKIQKDGSNSKTYGYEKFAWTDSETIWSECSLLTSDAHEQKVRAKQYFALGGISWSKLPEWSSSLL